MNEKRLTPEALIEILNGVNVAKPGGQRAPHKHLLLLLILARIQHDKSPKIPYSEIDQPLKKLLGEFGPKRASIVQEYPFWYLQSDGIWIVRDVENLKRKKGAYSGQSGH